MKKIVFLSVSLITVILLLVLNSCKTCKCPAYSYETKPEVTEGAEEFAFAGGEWRWVENSGE